MTGHLSAYVLDEDARQSLGENLAVRGELIVRGTEIEEFELILRAPEGEVRWWGQASSGVIELSDVAL